MPLSVEAAERLLPAGDEALHRCRAAVGHLLELPATTEARIADAVSALDQRAKERLKLVRYVGTISALGVFFFAAFLLKDWESPFGLIVALLLGSIHLPLALHLHRKRHEREREALVASFKPISAAERTDLVTRAERWPETLAALRRWKAEGRPFTENEHCAVRRFEWHRTALEDELRALEALDRALGERVAEPTPTRATVQQSVHPAPGSTVIAYAEKVELRMDGPQR